MVMSLRAFFSALVLSCILFTGCRNAGSGPGYCIQQGDFSATLTESGELLAVNARSVLVPYIGWKYGWQFKLTGLVEHGAHVNEGDSVAQLDEANVMKYLLEQETLLETEQANLNKLLVENECRFEELDAQLQEVQANYDLKKLELEKYKFESQRKKEIKQLEFQQSGIHLNRIKKTIELEKTICQNSLKIQKIKVSQIESNVAEAKQAIGKLTILSPIDGIFQISRNRRNDQIYRMGDDTYQGAELALVPDLSVIKVKSTISETDIGKVQTGQKVIVRLEAFPERPFPGKVSDIGKLSYDKEEGSTVKVFDLEVVLEQSDPVLKPGMTVSCELFYAELSDVYYVDNRCLKKVDNTFYLTMNLNDEWVELPVEIGPRNNSHTVVYGDLEQGTELMIPQKEAIAMNQ